MKQDNITEMHIYVKYKIVSFMRRQFSSLKVYIKIVQNRKKKQKKNKKQKTKNKTKVGICTLCVILMMAYAIHSNVRNLGLFFIYDKVHCISKWKRTEYFLGLDFDPFSGRKF